MSANYFIGIFPVLIYVVYFKFPVCHDHRSELNTYNRLQVLRFLASWVWISSLSYAIRVPILISFSSTQCMPLTIYLKIKMLSLTPHNGVFSTNGNPPASLPFSLLVHVKRRGDLWKSDNSKVLLGWSATKFASRGCVALLKL